MRNTAFVLITTIVLLPVLAGVAGAVDNRHEFPVAHAKESKSGQNLLDVPFYMKGEKHPAVASKLGEFKSNKKSNGFGKEDQVACDHAFASAVIALQQRAQREGGNAVIDVYSITKDVKFESPDSYACVAGNTVVHVALMGTVAKLE